MIVSCPSCRARYKVDEAKIKGRGAKITCPRCRHVFVVYKDQDQQAPAPAPDHVDTVEEQAIERRDFRDVGITWQVRRGARILFEVYDLESLRDRIDEGQIEYRDSLSYDKGRTWLPLDSVPDMARLFEDVWTRASRGEIDASAPGADEVDDDEELDDEEDAPTTIVNREVSLASAIRRAVREATPAAPPSRDTTPSPSPTPSRAPQAAPVPAPSPAPAPRPGPTSTPAPAPSSGGGSSVVLWVILSVVGLLILAGLALVGLGVVQIPGLSDSASEQPDPAVEQPAPAEEQPAAAVEQPAPTDDQPAPADEEEAPPAEATPPAEAPPAPAEEAVPADETSG